jgi:transposase-like protein
MREGSTATQQMMNMTLKKYLCDNCDYTFNTLKENMPKALKSMQLQTIWRWEHQMYRWMDAYRAGMGTMDAQKQVKKFSSTKYKSHRRILENVAHALDG